MMVHNPLPVGINSLNDIHDLELTNNSYNKTNKCTNGKITFFEQNYNLFYVKSII